MRKDQRYALALLGGATEAAARETAGYGARAPQRARELARACELVAGYDGGLAQLRASYERKLAQRSQEVREIKRLVRAAALVAQNRGHLAQTVNHDGSQSEQTASAYASKSAPYR